MDFYVVDVRDRVIQWVTQEYRGVDNQRFFLLKTLPRNKHGPKPVAHWPR